MNWKEELSLLEDFTPPTYDEWKQVVIDSLKGADFEKTMFTNTFENVRLQPIYRREDTLKLPLLENLPGESPYLRGCGFSRVREQGWLIAQSHHESDPQVLRKQLLNELQLGLTAVNIKVKHHELDDGLDVHNQEVLDEALNGVDLQAAPLFMQLDMIEHPILKHFERVAAKSGTNPVKLQGFLGFDPTGEFARKGYLELPLEEIWQSMLDVVNWNVEHLPQNRVVSIDATVYEAAGASSAQELGFALSTAIGYLQGLLYSGIDIDNAAPLFRVNLSLGSNMFMEIAKVRAMRILWAEMIRSFEGNEESRKIWIHGKTASFNKSAYDVYVNLLRTATEGFAGVIGGADSLEIANFDTLVAPESEFSARMARNQQVILKEEVHLDKVVDPGGGSYYIESLTQELANRAWEVMQEIESAGGMIRALRAGKVHEMISDTAQKRITAVHKRSAVAVGVNMYADPAESAPKTRPLQNRTDAQKAVELGAGPLPRLRVVGLLEELRANVQTSTANTKILLLNMGSVAEYKARADFALGFLQPGGYKVLSSDGLNTPEAALKAAEASEAAAFCICSTDDNYQHLVPEICQKLNGKKVILAGYPTDKVDEYRNAGVDIFIHMRANMYDTLRDLARLMGVTA